MRPTSNSHPVGGGVGWIHDPESSSDLAELGKERAMPRSLKDLKGSAIGATDGDIGRVEALDFHHVSSTVRHLVVDAGGWLGGRKVLISPRALATSTGPAGASTRR